MNKSKFLKKSLAMLLAVMLVVAMIPLGASAAWQNDGVVVSITSGIVGSVLDGSGTTFADTLPYYAAGKETLTINLDKSAGITAVDYEVDDGDTAAATVAGTTATIANLDYPAKVTFQGYDTDGEAVGSKYTVNLTQTPASTDTSLKSAEFGGAAGTAGNVKGVISGKTITFTVPWGYNLASGSTVSVFLNNPVNGNDPQTDTVATLGEDDTIAVTSQHGNTTTYTVVTKETTCLTSLTIGGVAAVWDEEDEEYTVTLPADTDFDEAQKITYKTGATPKGVKWGTHGGALAAISSEEIIADNGAYDIEFTSRENTTKTYKVNVTTTKSNDATITGFTASVVTGGKAYVENGVVSGDKLTVELPYGSALTSVDLAFETATGATLTVGGSSTLTGVDLSAPKTVEVIAADTTTVKYYQLSATVAANPYGDPKITAAKLTLGTEEYVGAIADSSKTITFTVPYATNTAAVKAGTLTWAKSQHTQAPAPSLDATDVFTGTNSVSVTSDNGDKVTYALVFKKDAARTGKTLQSLSLSSAVAEDDVTADNTFAATVTSNKIKITLPYSYDGNMRALVPQFKLPDEGAALYVNDSTTAANLDKTPVESGYDEDGDANTTIADFSKVEKIVVADETAVLLLSEEAGTVVIDTLSKTAAYRNHITVYTVEIEYAPAQTGCTLNSFTANEGKVTSKITSTGIEITVPYSYVGGAAFFADYTASKLADVKAGSTLLPDTAGDAGDAGELKITGTVDAPVLEVYNGTSWAPVSTITVTNEANTDSNKYDVTVKAAAAKTGALLTSVKVNNTNGVIDNAKKTVTVTLPVNTDLTAVTLAIVGSDMATITNPLVASTVDDVDYYDVTESFKVTVTAEDGQTINVYDVTVTASTSFVDVQPSDWFYGAVMQAAADGIVYGKPDGTFGPMDSVTRQDFAVMLVRMLGVDVSSYTTTPFSDTVPSYAVGAVAYCAEKGYISGNGSGKFEGSRGITRQEAASIMTRTLSLTGTTADKFKDDAKIDSWAVKSVYACKAAGIFKGDDKGNFNPKKSITRAEAATVMVGAKNK